MPEVIRTDTRATQMAARVILNDPYYVNRVGDIIADCVSKGNTWATTKKKIQSFLRNDLNDYYANILDYVGETNPTVRMIMPEDLMNKIDCSLLAETFETMYREEFPVKPRSNSCKSKGARR